jgi:hypothetical protein
MTEWIKPCADAACIEHREVPGGVQIRTGSTDLTLFATTEEWDAFVTGLRADLVTERDRWKRQYGFCLNERDEAMSLAVRWKHELDAARAHLRAAALNEAADDINQAATIMSPEAAKIYRQLALTLQGWARRELKS